MILLVSYDLKVPGKDYKQLYEVLKTAPGWWHHLESTWILSTGDSISTWREKIRAAMDSNDSFIVVDITGRRRDGWLPKDAWDWLQKHDDNK
jgi:hypothetical protein